MFHIAQRDPKKAAAMLPRKDTDVLIVDRDREKVILNGVDTPRRHTYQGDWMLHEVQKGKSEFPYWKNRHTFLDVSLPNIDVLNLSPGLYIPDEVFLLRMLARRRLVDAHPSKSAL